MVNNSDVHVASPPKGAIGADDEPAVWGGVYLGPATDILTTNPNSPEAQLVRRASQRAARKSRESPSQRGKRTKSEEEKDAEAPVWGGVYVGPGGAAAVMKRDSKDGSHPAPADKENNEPHHHNLRESFRVKAHSLTKSLKERRASKERVEEKRRRSSAERVEDRPDSPKSPKDPKSPPSTSTYVSGAAGKSGKVRCENCKKKCTGDVLRAGDKYFHAPCFTCKVCRKLLSEVGYFEHNGEFFCPEDYHAKFGSRCPVCQRFVEGEVVMCMGKTYHQGCFRCDRCRKPFPSGQKVTFTGREHLCQECLHTSAKTKPGQIAPIGHTQAVVLPHAYSTGDRPGSPGDTRADVASPTVCAACGDLIHSGQVLLALDTQWHIWCFRCQTCDGVLHGEFMAKDGRPYCIRDYNAQFGVRCDECGKFIAGKVLQAGDYHFHPSCARCVRCGEPFGDGEEMFMQGDEIWHPRCNDLKPPDTIVHFPASEAPRSPGTKPHFTTPPRSPRSSTYGPKYTIDFGKHLTYSYLLPEPNLGYLRQPISPHPPQTPQFHTPSGKPVKIRKSRVSFLKTGMQKLTESLEEKSPRPRSPHMDNEEPIELAHFPGAHFPEPNAVPAIEREDFPAPPYPYAVEEYRRRLSESSAGSEEEDEEPDPEEERGRVVLMKGEQVLKTFENESSLAHVFVHDLEEHMKMKPRSVDPRSSSRTPNAKKMPHLHCRYESPINASPSRYLNRPRPWEKWDRNKRSATSTIPHYQVPKPGYGLAPKAATLPGEMVMNGYYPDMSFDELDTTRSSYYSDRSSTLIGDGRSSVLERYEPRYGSGAIRTSLPDMSKPPKIYSYAELLTSNKKLPDDVDRCHLERHLSRDEFDRIFHMTPLEFYKLPDWKRVNLKRKARLF